MIPANQIDYVIKQMAEWARTKDNMGLAADIMHSSLLRRLLRGKQVLPKPPPKRHAYPDYDLAEGKQVEVFELFEDEDRVVIDQHGDWTWVNKKKGILRHSPTGALYRTWIEDGRRQLQKTFPEVPELEL
jgi:hypothetical protein